MRKPLVDTPADIPVNTPADAPVSAWLALGGNLGNAQQNVLDAIESISRTPHISLQAASSLYRSAPFEASGPDFINAVVQVSTTLAPHALLAVCQHIENAAGRQRPYRNAPRTLDIDILLYGNVSNTGNTGSAGNATVINTPALTLPHPRMYQRAFVLLPLAEIAPQHVSPAQLQAIASQPITKLPATV